MPVIKSAKKKLKQDKVRTLRNKLVKDTYKELLKNTYGNNVTLHERPANIQVVSGRGVMPFEMKHSLSTNNLQAIKSATLGQKAIQERGKVAGRNVGEDQCGGSPGGSSKGSQFSNEILDRAFVWTLE